MTGNEWFRHRPVSFVRQLGSKTKQTNYTMLGSRSIVGVTSTVKAAVGEKGRPALDSAIILSGMKGPITLVNRHNNSINNNNNNNDQLPDYIVDPTTRTTYLKGKFLGKGGFARVHELTDLTTNKVYAGKIIPKNRITKPHHREKIVREIELHRTLKHENVVRFHHFFEDEENVYIILENCSHKSMVHVLKHRRTLTEPEVRYYLQQLIAGVQYIHSQRVIHRDLKLGNMFLNEDLVVKIGDFGLATRVENNGPKKTTICGTPNYIAPEVLNKQGHSYGADVWAIGCIMYAMMVGQPPFETNTMKETYSRIVNNKYVIPSFVSTDARSLITKLLHPDPNQRLDLSTILDHEFFVRGCTPRSLPPSSYLSPPKFSSKTLPAVSRSATVSPDSTQLQQQQNSLTSELRKLRRTMSQLCLSGSKSDSKLNNITGKIQAKATKKESGLQNTIRQKLSNVLTYGKKTKPMTASALHQQLAKSLDIMPQNPISHQITLDCPNVNFVTKWIDYSNKYGFGFQLSDKSVGVLFNDGSKIGFTPDRNRMEFYDCNGKISSHSTSAIPIAVQDHHKLLKYFAKYMDENLTEGGNLKSSELKNDDYVPVMQRWVRTTKAIIMQLNTGMIQVNFFKDHTKIILSEDNQNELMVTFIDENRDSSTFNLAELVRFGCQPHIHQRLLHVRSMLRDFAQLESTEV